MKLKITSVALAVLSLSAIAILSSRVHATDTSAANLSKIYDESADGFKQIREAGVPARKDGKNILIQFGANWCPWCHKLRRLYGADKRVAEALKSNYVLVMVDVDKDHNKAVDMKYGHPRRFGIPVLVILDADGKLLTTKNTEDLIEGDHFSPEKVVAFLKDSAPKKRA